MELYAQYAQEAALKERVDLVHGAITSASREVIRPIPPALPDAPLVQRDLRRRRLRHQQLRQRRDRPAVGEAHGRLRLQDPRQALLLHRRRLQRAPDHRQVDRRSSPRSRAPRSSPRTSSLSTWRSSARPSPRSRKRSPDWLSTCLVGAAHTGFYRQWYAAGMLNEIPIVSVTFGVGNEHVQLSAEEGNGIVSAQPYFQELQLPANLEFVEALSGALRRRRPVSQFGGCRRLSRHHPLVARRQGGRQPRARGG